MGRIDPALVAAVQTGMGSNQNAVFEDARLVGMVCTSTVRFLVASGTLWRLPPSKTHAFVADPAFDAEHGAIGDHRQRDQAWLLLGKRFVDDAAGGGVDAPIGDQPAPLIELGMRSSILRNVRPRKKSWRI